MIKDLIKALESNPELMNEFQRDPHAMLDKFGVQGVEREALQSPDPDIRSEAIGGAQRSRFQQLQAPFEALQYPGEARTQISSVSGLSSGNPEPVRVQVTWDHTGIPQTGLPRFASLSFAPAPGGSLLRYNLLIEKIDCRENSLGAVTQRVVALEPGDYMAMVSFGHDEILDAARPITVQ